MSADDKRNPPVAHRAYVDAEPVAESTKRFRKHGETLSEALPWILERVKSGIPINHACEAAGFSKQALYKHCQKHPDDKERLDQAKAEGEQWLVEGLYEAARDDPRFGLLLLERRRPEEWSKPEKVELTGKDGGAIAVTAAPPTRALAIAELARMLGEDPETLARRLADSGGDVAGLLAPKTDEDGE